MQRVADQSAGAVYVKKKYVAGGRAINLLTHCGADVMLSVLVKLVHSHLEETI